MSLGSCVDRDRLQTESTTRGMRKLSTHIAAYQGHLIPPLLQGLVFQILIRDDHQMEAGAQK